MSATALPVVEVKDAKAEGLWASVYLNDKLIYDVERSDDAYGNFHINVRYEIDMKELGDYYAVDGIDGKRAQRNTCTRGNLYNVRNTIRIDVKGIYYKVENNQIWLYRRYDGVYNPDWEPVISRPYARGEEKKLIADFSPQNEGKIVVPVQGWPNYSPPRVDKSKVASLQPLKVESKEQTVAILQVEPEGTPLAKYLNNFIATLSGNYITPHAYAVDPSENGKNAFTIISKPIYGFVLIRTIPDNRFYLKYERDDQGALVGEMVRTQLIPMLETAQKEEVAGVLEENGQLIPVYYSYYDPAGSGKQITREEYAAYVAQKREIVAGETGLPRVLADLLKF